MAESIEANEFRIITDTYGEYKNVDAYRNGKGICYISESATENIWWDEHAHEALNGQYWLESEILEAGCDQTGAYTRNDILELCNGRTRVADMVFDLCSWQSPSTVLDELDEEDYAIIEEQEVLDSIGSAGVSFMELPMSGRIGMIEVELDRSEIKSGMSETVHVAYDAEKHPNSREAWEAVKAHVEREFPTAPWVLIGLDNPWPGEERDAPDANMNLMAQPCTVEEFGESFCEFYTLPPAELSEAISRAIANERIKDSVETAPLEKENRESGAIDPKGSVVLETFAIEGHELPDALIFRPNGVQHYVVAHDYDAQTGEWSYGDYFSDPASAYEKANPKIIEGACLRMEVEDLHEILESFGCEPNAANVAVVLSDMPGYKGLAPCAKIEAENAARSYMQDVVCRLQEADQLEYNSDTLKAWKEEDAVSLASETKDAMAAKDELGATPQPYHHHEKGDR